MAAPNKLIYVDERSTKRFIQVSSDIKKLANSKQLTKELSLELRSAAKPLQQEARNRALGIEFENDIKSDGPGKRATRGSYKTKKGNVKLGKSLRQQFSAGITTQLDRRSYSAGVRVQFGPKNTEILKLGKVLNKRGKIRHPLFGDKDYWYDTKTTNGIGWFSGTGADQMPVIRKRVERVLESFEKRLANTINRAA